MKERQPAHEQPTFTARDAAKALIRPYVARGDAVEAIARGAMGYSGPDYAAQIGGAAIDPDGNVWAVGSHRIAVTRIGEQRVFARFKLEQIHREVQDEADPSKYRQARLF